jgi:hypothetical protein
VLSELSRIFCVKDTTEVEKMPVTLKTNVGPYKHRIISVGSVLMLAAAYCLADATVDGRSTVLPPTG